MEAYASIIPLNYDTHFEFSIFIFDPEWSNLIGLLTDPQDTLSTWGLGAPGSRWGQIPLPENLRKGLVTSAGAVPWQLNNPASAVIRPILDRTDLAPVITGLAGSVSVGDEVVTFLPGTVSRDYWQTYVESMWEQVFQEGFYVAEFAVDTAMLFITYLPPLKPHQFYVKSYSTVTVATLQGTDNPTGMLANQLGTLHCDLADASGNTEDLTTYDRACFAVDTISYRAPFLAVLNGQPDIYLNYRLAPEGNMISLTPPAPANPPATNMISFQTVPVYPNHPHDFPTLTMEGLTNASTVDTCCNTDFVFSQAVTPQGVQLLNIGNAATKTYPPDGS